MTFDDDALRTVAERAFKFGTGARGLRAIVEKLLRKALFDVPESRIERVHVFKDKAKGRVAVVYHPGGETSMESWEPFFDELRQEIEEANSVPGEKKSNPEQKNPLEEIRDFFKNLF